MNQNKSIGLLIRQLKDIQARAMAIQEIRHSRGKFASLERMLLNLKED